MKMQSRRKTTTEAKQVDTTDTCAAGSIAASQETLEQTALKKHATLPWWQKLLPSALLSGLTWLFYSPSLNSPFQFDDIANITKKFAIRFDNPFSRWLINPRWFGDWLNRVNYQIGKFDPFWYRFFNVTIHMLAGLVLFALVFNLCKNLKNKPFLSANALMIAFTTAGLFLLHPVQTQTVSYVIQARLEGLATLFVLLALYLFSKAVLSNTAAVKIGYYASFVLASVIACGTKEVVVVLPFLLVMVDWFFLAQEQWTLFKNRLLAYGAFGFGFMALLCHYVGPKLFFDILKLNMVSGNNRGNILTPNAFDIITPFQFLMSEFKVVVHYFAMFFWPFNISVEYDWKLAQSFFSAQVIFPLLVIIAAIAFAIYLAKNKTYSHFAFGFFWFLFAIAPRASIIPSPELVCDYKTYLASIGVLFIIAVPLVQFVLFVLKQLREFPEVLASQQMKAALMATLLIPLGVATLSRNQIWETSVAFWQDNVIKAPNKARSHNNLGVALCESGKFDEAIKEYQEAVRLDKQYSDPLSNIAVAYSLKGDTDKAIDSLKAAIHITPNYPEAYNNLGTLLLQKKMYEDAEKALDVAIKLRPYYGKAYYNLARLYEEKGDNEKSWDFLKKASEGDLDVPEVFFKLGQMGLRVKKYQESIVAFQRIIDAGRADAQVWFNLGNAYFMDKAYARAQAIYERLVRDHPLDGRYAYNLGETYFTQDDYPRALETFKKVASLPQPLPQSFFRVANCLEKLNKSTEAKNYLEDLLHVNAPEEFKKVVRNEIMRIDLQAKVNANGGRSIKLNDLQTALAMNSPKSSKKKSA